MAPYCVIISGRLPGDKDDSAVWAPIAKGFKLDGTAFAERVLPRLPLIVKQGLDQAAARALADQLRATGVDAKPFPDDTQPALFERDGQTKGPIPYASLGDFVHVGERYRLRNDADWSIWTGGAEPDPPLFSLDEPSMDTIPPASVQTAQQTVSPVLGFHPAATPEDEPPPLPGEEILSPASALWSGWVPPKPDFPPDDETPPPFPDEVIPPRPGSWDQRQSQASADTPPFIEEPPPPPAATARTSAPVESPKPKQAPVVDRPGASQTPSSCKPWGLILGAVGLGVVALGVAGYFFAFRHHPPTEPVAQASSTASSASSHQQAPITAKTSPPAPASPETQQVPSTQPQPPNNGGASVADNCSADAPAPNTPEEKELVASGNRHLTGKAARGGLAGETYAVEAALGYDGQCRPDPYQIYVFHNQKLVGTVVPQAMHARSDGAITDFKLLDAQHLQADIAHYGPDAPACCASSTETRVFDLGQLWGTSSGQAASSEPTTPNAPHAGVSPSFDCQKAQSPTEIAICSDSHLSQLDAEMGHTYHAALSRLSQRQAEALKDDQRQWIRERVERCGAAPICLEQNLRQRISQLQRSAANAATESRQAQLEQGKLEAANQCYMAANYDCSIQIATSLLNANPTDARASDLLRRSRQAQSKALQGNWNIH